MARFNEIYSMDLRLREDSHIVKPLKTLTLPTKWLDLFRALQSQAIGRPSQEATPPIRSLVNTVGLLMSDLVYVQPQGWQSKSNERTPWLLAWEHVPPEILTLITKAWVWEEFAVNRRANMEPRVEGVLGQLLPSDLAWQDELIDFSRCNLEPNGTARPAGSFFRALPDLACSYLSHTDVVFPIRSERLRFRRVLGRRVLGEKGPELVSWPPLSYSDRSGAWLWSYHLRLSVQTVPLQPYPVVRCYLSIRRWVSANLVRANGFVALPREASTTVNFLSQDRWLTGIPQPRSFASIPLELARSSQGGRVAWVPTWASSLPQILTRLQVAPRLPEPQTLVEDPASFISRSDGSAAMVFSNHHSHLGVRHHVGAGAPPLDRQMIFDRVLEVLAPHGFELTKPSYRIPLGAFPVF